MNDFIGSQWNGYIGKHMRSLSPSCGQEYAYPPIVNAIMNAITNIIFFILFYPCM